MNIVKRILGVIITLCITNSATLLVSAIALIPSSKFFNIILFIALGTIAIVILNILLQFLMMMLENNDADRAIRNLYISGIALIIIEAINIICYLVLGHGNLVQFILNAAYALFYIFAFKENVIS